MRKAKWAGLAILVSAAGLVLAQSGQEPQPRVEPQPKPQQPQAPPPAADKVIRLGLGTRGLPRTVKGRIAAATKLQETDVAKMLDALGPAVRDLLGQGETVEIPNLGTFRVVRIPEHKDMVDGRPATIPGSNYVEFLASGRFADAANLPGVQPAETVPPFEYNPLPDQTKGLRTPNTRQPTTRTR
jgi:nucleoid DNA-binding protein